MRHISGLPLFAFISIMVLCTSFAIAVGFIVHSLPLPQGFAPSLSILFSAFAFLFSILLIYRIWMFLCPFSLGPLLMGSRDEFNYQVYVLFWLVVFNFFIVPCWVPVPLTRLMYILFGSRIGLRSYSGGTLYDPHLIEMGQDCLIGSRAMLIPHFQQGRRLEHYKIKLGHQVTVGAMSIVMAGCELADGVILGAHSVLPKGSKVGANEIWAGNPAKFIRLRSQDEL